MAGMHCLLPGTRTHRPASTCSALLGFHTRAIRNRPPQMPLSGAHPGIVPIQITSPQGPGPEPASPGRCQVQDARTRAGQPASPLAHPVPLDQPPPPACTCRVLAIDERPCRLATYCTERRQMQRKRKLAQVNGEREACTLVLVPGPPDERRSARQTPNIICVKPIWPPVPGSVPGCLLPPGWHGCWPRWRRFSREQVATHHALNNLQGGECSICSIARREWREAP